MESQRCCSAILSSSYQNALRVWAYHVRLTQSTRCADIPLVKLSLGCLATGHTSGQPLKQSVSPAAAAVDIEVLAAAGTQGRQRAN